MERPFDFEGELGSFLKLKDRIEIYKKIEKQRQVIRKNKKTKSIVVLIFCVYIPKKKSKNLNFLK